MIPFEAINAAALAVFPELVADWLPAGVRKGNEWTLGDLSGAKGRSLSVNLRTAKWADFSGGGRGGDPLSLFAAIHYAGDRVEAARELGKRLGITADGSNAPRVAPVVHVTPRPVPNDWQPMDSRGVPEPDALLVKWDHVYRYVRSDGSVIGYVLRKNKPDGSRDKIVPLNYGDKEGVAGWHFKHLASPRPLYNLDQLAARPDAPVLVVEGEKAADAAAALYPEYVVTTWQAGTGNIAHVDWSPIVGREVVVWPDADIPGYLATAEILRTLPAAHVLDVVDEPQGFDAADLAVGDPADWLSSHLAPASHVLDAAAAMIAEKLKKDGPLPDRDWFASRVVVVQDEEPPHHDDYDGPQWDDDSAPDDRASSPPATPPAAAPAAPATERENIIPLGHDRGTYYYLSTSTGQVEGVAAGNHSRAMLSHLASETYYWSRTRFINKNGVDWNAAADDLRVRCRAAGIYNPDRLRGRGAWLDGDRSVLHVGDRCIVDGVEAGLMIPGSQYVYEHSPRLDMQLGDALSTEEANQLRALCCALPFESPDHMGQLLAGWCVIAPVCGAMPWRPHLWLTSEPGGGKTYVLENIIKPIVGPIALDVQSKTTEAGIRQTLGCDARPVIFDEAETQNERDRDRVQLVLDLARQASSEGGAAIIKGSANGKAMQYHIRSCFAFSSINVGMSQAADESRTVVLTLAPDTDQHKRAAAFARLKALHAQVMVPGFSGRLLARTLSLLPVIRQNSIVFAEAIARSGKPRRMGDTYGVLMAGAWSLRSRSVATADEADKMVAETQWVREAVVKADVEAEWQRALTTLLQHRARVTNGNGRTEDVPIGELIRAAAGVQIRGAIYAADATLALSRMGLRFVDDGGVPVIQIANHSSICAELFARTPWAASWLATLTRMPGAKRNATTARLAGSMTKVFQLPMPNIRDEEDY